jgi:hypothetical protein
MKAQKNDNHFDLLEQNAGNKTPLLLDLISALD